MPDRLGSIYMKELKIVIGKNFGDEGKGAATDKLCQRHNTLVVRHNGGAQAGHTVEREQFRFVFHQLGSGSLHGCPTYWSKTFLPDLLKLGEEMESLHSMTKAFPIKAPGVLYAHPSCACVTVYDVLLNSLREQLRGTDRHGSCGMGIFETVLRTGRQPHALCLHDFENTDFNTILSKLRSIRDNDTLVQLKALAEKYPAKFNSPEIRMWPELILDENILYNAADKMWENYNKYVILSDWPRLSEQYDNIVFENAQGLMLDWDNEEYAPHLTASYTGLRNIPVLLQEIGYANVHAEILYVTRAYVTRHGAGRLDHECAKEDINPHMTDLTNVPNPWQGALRYARHPAGNDFFRYIRRDLAHLPLDFCPAVSLLVTHLDETDNKVLFTDGERSFQAFVNYCQEQAPGLFRHVLSLNSKRGN